MNLLTLIFSDLSHRRNERRSAAEVKARQLKKFRRLVRHVQRRSPYYRNIIQQHGINVRDCVPEDFPVLNKAILQEHFDDIVTDRCISRQTLIDFLAQSNDPEELYQGRYTVLHTSGTSGEAGYFVYSHKDWARGASQSLRLSPLRPGKRRLAYIGATQGHYAGVSMALTARRSLLKFKYSTALFEYSMPVQEIIDGLNEFQPDLLIGYASCLALLAQKQQAGDLKITPRWIQSSGEVLTDADEALIETVFGVPVSNVYASTEHMVMGLGRREFEGSYLFEDDLYFELSEDHIKITNLFNTTLPLIRYQMNDRLEPQQDNINRYPFTKIKQVGGRSEQLPYFINDSGQVAAFNPLYIHSFMVIGLQRFQFEVVDQQNTVFRVCLQAGLNEQQRADALAAVESELDHLFEIQGMGSVNRKIEVVDELLPDAKTGKYRLIVM